MAGARGEGLADPAGDATLRSSHHSPPAPRLNRVLILKLRHIGDALLGTAVASALKRAAPGCRVSYLTTAGMEGLLALCPDVDRVLTVRRRARGADRLAALREQWALLRRLRAERFDLAVDLGGGDRSAFLAAASGAPLRVGVAAWHQTAAWRCRLYSRVVTRDVRAHTVQQDLDALRAAGVAVASAPVRVRVPQAARARAAERLRAAGITGSGPLVLVHPTSRWGFKTWPGPLVARCVTRLLAGGAEVALTSGPEPEEAAALVGIGQAVGGRAAAVFAGTLALEELAGMLAEAQAFLGVDSAPAHLAAALGVPSVVLFGPTAACNWGPWVATPSRTPYPEAGGPQAAGPHLVLQQPWVCSGCGMPGCLFTRRSDCLEGLGVGEVVEAVQQRIALGREAAVGGAG